MIASHHHSNRYDEIKKEYGKANRGSGKKFDLSLLPPEQHPTFSITPDKVRCLPACPGSGAKGPGRWGRALTGPGLAALSCKHPHVLMGGAGACLHRVTHNVACNASSAPYGSTLNPQNP